MKISIRHLAIIALITSNVIWGAASPIFKWSLQDIPPFTLAFLRFFLGTLLMLPFALPNIGLKHQDIPKIVLLAAIGITGHIAFYFFGLRLTSSINVPIILASTPIFLMLISFFYLHERPKKKVVLGTLTSLVGILLIIIRPLFEHGADGSLLGNFFLILSTICFVVYTVLLKKFDFAYPPLTFIFWLFFFGSFLFFPFFLNEMQTIDPTHLFEPRSLIGILYGALSSSTLAYLCYEFGVKVLKASEVGIFFYIDPITTILVAIPLLGERITPLYFLAALLVFAGIFISEQKFHYHHFHLLSRKLN